MWRNPRPISSPARGRPGSIGTRPDAGLRWFDADTPSRCFRLTGVRNARGFLTGRWASPDDLPADDWRRNHPRFQGDNFRKNLDIVDRVRRVAARKGCTPGQLALGWLLAHGNDIVPIPGSKRRERLEENAAAADIRLTGEDLRDIDALFPSGIAEGSRYPETAMHLVNR